MFEYGYADLGKFYATCLDDTEMMCIIIHTRGCGMKKRDLIRLLEKTGFAKASNSGRGSHDKYIRGADVEMIPRHKEVKEGLARDIIKKWGLK